MDGVSSGLVTTNLKGIIGSTLSAIRIRDPSKLDRKYLLHYLISKYELINKRTRGSAIPHTDRTLLQNMIIPIPTIDKQKKIATILDKTRDLSWKLQESIKLANNLGQSIFIKMFGDPAFNPKGWKSVYLSEIVSNTPQNGIFKKDDFYGHGTKIVWVENITNIGILDTSNLKKIELTDEERIKYGVMNKDVLITRSSHLGINGVGVMNVVDDLHEDVVFESHIMKLKVNLEQVNPYYLSVYFKTNYGRSMISRKAKRSTMSTINQPDLLRLEVLLPPLDLQKKFEILLKKMDTLQQKQPLLERKIKECHDSLKQKIFGDLEGFFNT